jgi:DNA-binding MarR family transcriptional regulator
MMAVGLTPRGEKLLQKVLPSHFRRLAQLMQPLSEAERKTLVRLLTKILARAAEISPATEPAEPAPAVAAH